MPHDVAYMHLCIVPTVRTYAIINCSIINTSMKKILLIYFLFYGFFCSAQTGKLPPSKYKFLKIRIIPCSENSWGYDIYNERGLYVHQPNVPGVPGNKGFQTKLKARKTAQLVCKKIRAGLTPPTLTVEELQKNNLIP